MIPDSSGGWTTPEQLWADLARMDRNRKGYGGRKPSGVILAVLAGLAAAAALSASVWILCGAVAAGDRFLAHIREEVTCALTVFSPAKAIWELSEDRPAAGKEAAEELTFMQPVPAPVEEREDPALLPGETRILQEGVDGLEEVQMPDTRKFSKSRDINVEKGATMSLSFTKNE